jgi:hypothetical protein
MNVIGHEAVADQRKPVKITVVPHQVEVDGAFSIRRENQLPRVATLCHLVRGAQSDDACESEPRAKSTTIARNRKRPVCPGFYPPSGPFGALAPTYQI